MTSPRIFENFRNRIQAKKDIQRHSICMTDADYDSILDQIERRDFFEQKWSVSSDEE